MEEVPAIIDNFYLKQRYFKQGYEQGVYKQGY